MNGAKLYLFLQDIVLILSLTLMDILIHVPRLSGYGLFTDKLLLFTSYGISTLNYKRWCHDCLCVIYK